MPRAIGFTASCYSLGLPPELFGLGTALANAQKNGYISLVEDYYPGLKKTILRAGKYLRKKSFKELQIENIEKEIGVIEEYVGGSLGPYTKEEKEHEQVVGEIIGVFQKGQNPHDLIEAAAILRKSLG